MQFTNQPISEASDIDLLQQVRDCLHRKSYTLHLLLEFSVERGVVLVQGRVRTFYQRQVAVECIRRLAGVGQVIDLIEVTDHPVPRQTHENTAYEQKSPDLSMRNRIDRSGGSRDESSVAVDKALASPRGSVSGAFPPTPLGGAAMTH